MICLLHKAWAQLILICKRLSCKQNLSINSRSPWSPRLGNMISIYIYTQQTTSEEQIINMGLAYYHMFICCKSRLTKYNVCFERVYIINNTLY